MILTVGGLARFSGQQVGGLSRLSWLTLLTSWLVSKVFGSADRQTDRQTDKQTDRQTDRQTARQTETDRDIQTDMGTERQRDTRWTNRQRNSR